MIHDSFIRCSVLAAIVGASACATEPPVKPIVPPAAASATPEPPAPDASLDPTQRRALAIALNLREKRFDSVVATFDEPMKAALTADGLAAAWNDIERDVGALSACKPLAPTPVAKGTLVIVECTGAKMNAALRVTFDAGGERVAGLYLKRVAPPPDPAPPAYAKMDAIVERDLTVGVLPATLTLPKDAKKAPGIVLVHGSGPNDRDETAGANRPFRDLALGLASRGIAVLRYEKRTFGKNALTIAALGDDLTIDDEVVNDAAEAIRTLEHQPGVDGERVFVLGHSLGGLCAPRIVAKEPSAKGMILLAAAARPLEDILVEQIDYLMRARGIPAAERRAAVEDATTKAARVKSPSLEKDTPKSELPLNVPAPYWLSFKRYDHLAVASKLGVPTLVLQGERDYQVTLQDFALWKGALAKNPLAVATSFPGLNHLFLAGTGPSLPTEYDVPGHVAPEVIEAIASFVERSK